MIAKGDSKRLKNKNKLIYNGKPMFLWNIRKGLKISKNFYFNSDDDEMIQPSPTKIPEPETVVIEDDDLIDIEETPQPIAEAIPTPKQVNPVALVA
mgnify:CR=1 FL=1